MLGSCAGVRRLSGGSWPRRYDDQQSVTRRTTGRVLAPLLLLRRGFLFCLALNECDLLDARGIGWAPGRDIRIVLESVVDDAALVGIHRLELQRAAGNAHALGQFAHAMHDRSSRIER